MSHPSPSSTTRRALRTALAIVLTAQLAALPYPAFAAPPSPIVTLPLALLGAAATGSQLPAGAEQCFVPDAAIHWHETELDRYANQYAFLSWKQSLSMPAAQYYPWGERLPPTRTPIFDVRFCEAGWGCPVLPEILDEVATMRSVGAAGQVASTYRSTEALNKTATTESVLSIISSGLETLDSYEKTEGQIKARIDQRVASWQESENEKRELARKSRAEMVDSANRYERSLRRSYDLAQRATTVPDSWKKRIVFAQAETNEWKEKYRGALERSAAQYRGDVAAANELKATHESLTRAKRWFDHLELLRTGLKTAINAEKADYLGATKSMLSVLEKLNSDYFIDWLKEDLGTQEKKLKEAIKIYNVSARASSGWMLTISRTLSDPKSYYGPLFKQASGSVAQAQSGYQEVADDLKTLESLKTGLKLGTQLLGYIESANSTLESIRKKMAPPADIVKANQDASFRATLDPKTAAAIAYFSSAGAALKKVSEWMQGTGVLAAVVDLAATYLDVAAQTVEAFTRLTGSTLQGGVMTPQGELVPLEDLFRLHPGLQGLRASVSMDDNRTVQIPGWKGTDTATITRQGPGNDLEQLLLALSAWTSLTGRNPDQDTIYTLAADKPLGVDVPYFEAGRFTLQTRFFTRHELANPSTRHVEEEQIGAVLRELIFLNQALSGIGPAYSYADLFDLGMRTRLSDLANHHLVLDTAYQSAYGAPIPPSVVGAVLAQSDPKATAVTSTSPLQRLLLNRAIAAGQVRAGAPPVAVSWYNWHERAPTAVDIQLGVALGALPENETVCRSVVATYPDGSTAATRILPQGPRDDPLTTSFTLPLDWSRLRDSTVLRLTLTAKAGQQIDTRQEEIKLRAPVTVHDIIALPSEAFAGTTTVELHAEALVPAFEETAQVGAEFTLTREGEAPETLSTEGLELVNEFSVLAKAKYKVPENVPDGTRYQVTATFKVGDYESKQESSFEVIPVPKLGIDPFEPHLTVQVIGEAPPPGSSDEVSPDGDWGISSGVAVSVLNGPQGTTDSTGTVVLGPLAEGSFTIEAKPPESQADLYPPGSVDVILTDFNPETESDPNTYTVTLLLPRIDYSDTLRQIEELKAEAGELLARGKRGVELAAILAEQSTQAGNWAGESDDTLAAMQAADPALRDGATLCTEAAQLGSQVGASLADAIKAELDLRNAIDGALALAANCTSAADADQIGRLHREAIQTTGQIGVLEKQARAGTARLGEIAGRMEEMKRLVAEQQDRAESIEEKATAAAEAASQVEAAAEEIGPIVESWTRDVTSLTAEYEALRAETPPRVLQKPFAELAGLVGHLASMGAPTTTAAVDEATRKATDAIIRAESNRTLASSLQSGYSGLVCDVEAMDLAVDDMGAMTTGATIELAAAADLPRLANECLARLQQAVNCSAAGYEAGSLISGGRLGEAKRKVAEMKAGGCDVSALEAQLVAMEAQLAAIEAQRSQLVNQLASAVQGCQFQHARNILGQLDQLPGGMQSWPAGLMSREAIDQAAAAQQEVEAVNAALESWPEDVQGLKMRLLAARTALPPLCAATADALLGTIGMLIVPPSADLPIPQPIPGEEDTTGGEIGDGQSEAPPPPASATSVRYPDMTGSWIIGGWPRETAYTITQSGNQIQWTHNYMWGAGMRRAVTTGEVSELSGTSARIVIDQTFYEPDGTTNKGYYTGDVTTDENGRAVHVFWSNNSTIERVD